MSADHFLLTVCAGWFLVSFSFVIGRSDGRIGPFFTFLIGWLAIGDMLAILGGIVSPVLQKVFQKYPPSLWEILPFLALPYVLALSRFVWIWKQTRRERQQVCDCQNDAGPSI